MKCIIKLFEEEVKNEIDETYLQICVQNIFGQDLNNMFFSDRRESMLSL